MRLIPQTLTQRILSRVRPYRPPDRTIGVDYLQRWYVIPRNRWLNIYLHRVTSDDEGRYLHDHPWVNLSIVLAGCYREVFHNRARLRPAGSVVARRAVTAHRLEVHRGPVWSLFVTGPAVRQWGFRTPSGWVHWREYEAAEDTTAADPCPPPIDY